MKYSSAALAMAGFFAQAVAIDVEVDLKDYFPLYNDEDSCSEKTVVIDAAVADFRAAAETTLQAMCDQAKGPNGIKGFKLINAETEQIIESDLTDGQVFKIGNTGDQLTIEVEMEDPDIVGKVQIFSAFRNPQTERRAPYAAFGDQILEDDSVNYFARTFYPFNKYTFKVQVFGKNGVEMGPAEEISFNLISDLNVNGCTSEILVEEIADVCGRRGCDPEIFLIDFFGTNNMNEVYDKFDAMCTSAWTNVPTDDWSVINGQLTEDYVLDFFDGKTKMNLGTGNLAQDPVPNYTTDAAVQQIADSVGDFYGGGDGAVQDSALSSVGHLDSCQHNAIMCCWGRDRQSNDNNGNCAADDCDDASPADNTNFCAIEDEGEGDTHCHGLAWSNDPNDFSAQFKYNNLFFVSMYDHWYQRGYVENSLDGDEVSEFGLSAFPMCSCIEEMPPVSRSDCTEMDVTLPFDVTISTTGALSATAGDIEDITFNACKGPRFSNGRNKNNDLSTYINKLEGYGKMTDAERMWIFNNVLVGYENPDDNQNEAACEDFIAIRAGVNNLKLWNADSNEALFDLTIGEVNELSLSEDLGGITAIAVEAEVPYVQLVRRVRFEMDLNGEVLNRSESSFPYFQYGDVSDPAPYTNVRSGGSARAVVVGGIYVIKTQAYDEDSNRPLGDPATVTIKIVA